MILMDSSGWLEIFTDSPLATSFEKFFHAGNRVIVSSICVYEVCRVLSKSSEAKGLEAVSTMKRDSLIVPVDETVSVSAADLAVRHGLGMADAMTLATARLYQAELITKDNDFRGIPGCRVIGR